MARSAYRAASAHSVTRRRRSWNLPGASRTRDHDGGTTYRLTVVSAHPDEREQQSDPEQMITAPKMIIRDGAFAEVDAEQIVLPVSISKW